MCPACIAQLSLVAAGATSGGGMTAFVFSKFYRSNKQIKTVNNQHEGQRSRKEKESGKTSKNFIAEGVGSYAPDTPREGEGVDPRTGRTRRGASADAVDGCEEGVRV